MTPHGLRRPDGPVKLTGRAQYAADRIPENVLYAALVTATIPRGRLSSVDRDRALAAPGVAAVLTHADMPRMELTSSPPLGQPSHPMQDDQIHYEGQPIAVVLAETEEQARHASTLVGASYDIAPAQTDFTASEIADDGNPDVVVGDLESGLAAAEAVIDETYSTANRHHSPIEPATTIARWDGDQLTVHASVQGISFAQGALATVFQVPADHVRVISGFVGGGFGCKAYIWPHTLITAAVARVTGRTVKLVLTRANSFTAHGYQPATCQRVTLAAGSDGRLTAIRHHSVNVSSALGDYLEGTTGGTAWMYASPAISLKVTAKNLNRAQPTPMRAPHEGPGMFALESAMDELAYALDIDPLELRLRNEPSVDPVTGKPFSSRPLRECLLSTARRFGWDDRPRKPRSLRQGHELVGYGLAVATMDTFRMPSSARVSLRADGTIVVEAGTQEIGTGVPGVLSRIAADVLGGDPGSVEVRHGDTSLPPASITAGSMATMSVGSAVHAAATELRDKLESLEAGDEPGHAGRLKRAGMASMEAEGRWEPANAIDGLGRPAGYSMHTYGAVMAEVRVDADLGLVRMPRCVGTYAAGRIINPQAARSQMTGGIAWGYGQALLESSEFDAGLGRFVSKNLAGYLVPVNADIGELDVSFVDEPDPHASATGAKGIGELGAVGVSAAIANAVYHATGVRVRDLPISLNRLL